MEFASFGLRDGILLLVALAAVYLVVMLLKLTRTGRRRPPASANRPPAEKNEVVAPLRQRAEFEPVIATPAAVSAYENMAATTGGAEPFAVPPAPTFEWDDVKELFGEEEEAAEVAVPAAVPASPRRSGFGEPLANHLARTDVEMEVQRMRDEMERMRAEVEELRAARRVSPQYAEAMELAQRGLSAQDVADRLGISLAEAELVHALSRGRPNFDEGDEHGGN